LEGSYAESFDGIEDVVGGFCPAEWTRVLVVDLDERSNVLFEGLGRVMDASSDLLFGEKREDALHLIDPRGSGRREVHMPARALGEPVADRLGLVDGAVVHHDMDVEIGRDTGFDLIEELYRRLRARSASNEFDARPGSSVKSFPPRSYRLVEEASGAAIA
jgi:hypothetical protein